MSTNWGKYIKRFVLTFALALTVFGPIDYTSVRDTTPTSVPAKPAEQKAPIYAEPQVNWNS